MTGDSPAQFPALGVGAKRKLVCLTGFMGSGKTTIGRLLAQQLGWRFVDLDPLIEEHAGLDIPTIFARLGEPAYREMEHEVLQRVLGEAMEGEKPTIVALGGGTFVQPQNQGLLRETGSRVIWLECAVEVLLARCATMTNRPLFRDEDSFRGLYEQRRPFYEMADFRVESSAEPRSVVEQILALGLFPKLKTGDAMNRTTRTVLSLILLLFTASGVGVGSADAQEKAKKAPAAAPAAVLAEDRGKFRAYVDGQAVGIEDFSIGRSGSEWLCRGTVEVKIPGGATEEVTSELRLTSDGAPVAYQWSTKGTKKASGVAGFKGGSTQMELRAEGSPPFAQEFQFESPKIIVLDNNLYHHYAVLARLYDWNAKGAQTFSVLIPQDLTPGTVSVEWAGPQEIGGAKYEMLRVRSADLDIELYVVNGRLERILVPTAKVEVRRE